MTLTAFSVGVQFDGSGLNSPYISPSQMKVVQREYNHDVVTLQFWGGDVDSDSLESGAPMTMIWGNGFTKRAFYGYVNHADRTNNQSPSAEALTDRNAVTVTCVGASWPMKQAGSATYSNTPTWIVIAQMAAKYGFDTDIVPDTTLWPSLQQAGISDWAFCVMLAKKIGYTFYTSGTRLVYRPRQTNPNALSSVAAIYDLRANPALMPIFNPQLGATSPGGGQLANRQLGGINPRTNQPIFASVSGSPSPTALGSAVDAPVFNVIEHGAVHSQAEANALMAGAGALNQLYISASAQAAGNPLVSQGSLIYVQNGNGTQNGLWFVTEANHNINSSTYSMPLKVGRDSRGAATSINVTIQTEVPPAPRLIGSTWVAG